MNSWDFKTLLGVFEERNAQYHQLIGKDFTDKTVQRYETTARYLQEFMRKQYNISDIVLNDIDPAFIRNFDIFLKVEKNCAQNAAIQETTFRIKESRFFLKVMSLEIDKIQVIHWENDKWGEIPADFGNKK